MARKPNYAFERNAKAKAKAEKRQAKLAAKMSGRKVPEEPDSVDDDAVNTPTTAASDENEADHVV